MLTCRDFFSGSSARYFLLCKEYRPSSARARKQRIKAAPGNVDAPLVRARIRAGLECPLLRRQRLCEVGNQVVGVLQAN